MKLHSPAPALAGLFALLLSGCSPADAADPLLDLTAPSFSGGGAGPPVSGSGTGMITSLQITSHRTAGSNVIQERRIEGVLEGALAGTFTEHARGVIHGTGLVTFQATLEFTGTVQGCGGEVGTLTASLSGRGQAGLPVTEAAFRVIAQGQNTLRVSGTGHMRQVGPAITYDLRYVCE